METCETTVVGKRVIMHRVKNLGVFLVALLLMPQIVETVHTVQTGEQPRYDRRVTAVAFGFKFLLLGCVALVIAWLLLGGSERPPDWKHRQGLVVIPIENRFT